MYQNNPLALYHETDQKAHQAATSPHNNLPEPTPDQKESGDYAKGRVTIAGLPISIENPQYSTRTGVDADGQEWSVTMRTHYGYLEGTLGADGDEVDVILMPRTEPDFAGDVYVIEQIDPSTGEFDEHKVVIGAFDEDQAIEAYHANYDDDWQGFGGIKSLDMAAFKEWLSLPPDGMMFDSLGQGIGAITDQDVQDDPLGVLDVCLKDIENINNSKTVALTSWDGDKAYEQFKVELAKNLDDPISAAKSFFSKNLQGKSVKTKLGIVAINSKSKGKMLHRMRPAALMAIPYIPNILLDGDIGQRTLADKERKDSLVAFYEFTKVLTVEKFKIEARIKVGEYESQDGYLAYYLAGKKESPFVSSSGAESKNATTKGQNQAGFDSIQSTEENLINIEIVSVVDMVSGHQVDDIDIHQIILKKPVSPKDQENTNQADIDSNYDIMATANPTSKAGVLSLAIEQQRQNRKYFTDANKQALQKRTTITDDSITSQQAAKASVDKLQAMYADEIATINQKYGESTIEIGTAQDVERSNEDEEKHVLIVGANWFGLPSVLSPDEDQAIIDRLIDEYAYYEHSPVDFDDDDELRKFSKHLNKVREFLAVYSEKDVDDVMQMAMLWFGFQTNTFERSLNNTLFDSMGTGLEAFTHDDIERDPLGVLAACLMTLQQPTAIDPNNHKQTLRYVNQAVDQLASASLAQRSISFDYFIEMKNLMVAAGYPISDILDIEQKLMTSAIIGGDARRSEAKGLLYSEYAKNAQDVFTIASDIQDDVLLYDQRIKTAAQARNAEIQAAWSTHIEYQNSVVNAYNNLSQETPEDIEKAAALLAEYHELRKTTWEKIKAPYEDAFRSEKDQMAATLVTHGQAIIDKLIYTATIDEPMANDWASQQIITGAAVKHLKKIKYPEVQVRKDLAQLYRITNGRISHVMLDHISGTRRAYTVETQDRTSSKAIYLDGDFDKRTLFHEMGHHMESDKAALAAAQGFLKGKRGSDDKLYRLKNLVPNSKYDAQELAYKGDFFNPYVGKHYQDGTTEVWSMGLESFADPVVLSQRIEYDTAMFAMIVGGIRAEKHPFAEVSTALAGQKVSSRIEDLKKIEFIRNGLTEKIAQKVTLSKTENIHPDLLEIIMYTRPDAVYIGTYKDIHIFSAKVRNIKTRRKGSGYVITWRNLLNTATYRVEAADPDFDMIKVYVGLIKTMAGSFSASAFLSMQKHGIPLEELNNAWQILKDE